MKGGDDFWIGKGVGVCSCPLLLQTGGSDTRQAIRRAVVKLAPVKRFELAGPLIRILGLLGTDVHTRPSSLQGKGHGEF